MPQMSEISLERLALVCSMYTWSSLGEHGLCTQVHLAHSYRHKQYCVFSTDSACIVRLVLRDHPWDTPNA